MIQVSPQSLRRLGARPASAGLLVSRQYSPAHRLVNRPSGVSKTWSKLAHQKILHPNLPEECRLQSPTPASWRVRVHDPHPDAQLPLYQLDRLLQIRIVRDDDSRVAVL